MEDATKYDAERGSTEASCQDGGPTYPMRRNVLTRREMMALHVAERVVGNECMMRRMKFDTANVAAFAVDVTDSLLEELYNRGRK